MTQAPQAYSLASEAITAWLQGILVFAFCCCIVWLIYFFGFSGFLSEVPRNIEKFGISQAFLWSSLALLFWAWTLFWGILFLAIASLPQILLCVLPLTYFMSKSLEDDAKFSWFFYIAISAIIGGLPWLVVYYYAVGTKADLGSQLVIGLPGPMVGAFSGTILKTRLLKMRRTQTNHPTNLAHLTPTN